MQKGSKRAAVAGGKVFETDFAFGIAINREVFLAGISAERRNVAFTNSKAEVVEDTGTAVEIEDAAVGSSKRERSANHGVSETKARLERESGGRISDCLFLPSVCTKNHIQCKGIVAWFMNILRGFLSRDC